MKEHHGCLYPAHPEQISPHVIHHPEEIIKETHDLLVNPVEYLAEDNIGHKMKNKQLDSLPSIKIGGNFRHVWFALFTA